MEGDIPFTFELSVFEHHKQAINVPEVRCILSDDVGLNAVNAGLYAVVWQDGMFYVFW